MTENINHNQVIETTLLRGKVKLLQPKVGFHASVDTVFLAAAVSIKPRQKLLDVGCGVGSAGLCVLARKPDVHLTGLDIQPDITDLALQNARLNGWQDRCRFFQGNVLNERVINDNAFHAVMMNPPYQEGGRHTPSPVKNKSFSHGEEASGATLLQWIKCAHKKLKNGGDLFMVHRADRLDDIIASLTGRRWFGSIVIFPLYSYTGDDAKRVIIRARKERYAPAVLKSGLVIHEKGGAYTKEAQAILSDAASISL